METRCRRAAIVVAVAVATASGWVYPYLRPRPADTPAAPSAVASPPPSDRVQLWHGRVVKSRDRTRPEDRQWLVECPMWNVHENRHYVEQVWFWVAPGTVTDRRTGQPSELAVGQRVSVLWHGVVATSNPGQCRADAVVIELEELPPARP